MPHRTGDDHSLNGRSPNDFDHVQQAKAMSPVDTHPPFMGASQVHVNDYRYSLQKQPLSRDEDYNRSATPDLLLAPRAPMLQRQDSTISSNHDGDSVFDLYGGGRMSTVSAASLSSFVPLGGAEVFPSFVSGNDLGNMASEEPDSSKWIHKDKLERDDPDSSKWIHRDKLVGNDPDSSKWIHRDKLAKIEADDAGGRVAYNTNVDSGTSRWIDRDKLAKIESQELQRAAIVASPRSRASTNSTMHRGNENDHSRDQKKQRVASPLPIEDENEQLFNNPNEFSNDLRTPEEQAADLAAALQNMASRQFRRNASYSRIPVPTASPFPIPQQYLERTTPLLRNSTPSGSDDDKASLTNTYIRSRKRSHSAGSAFLLDDPTSALAAPATVSNPKNRSRTPGSPRKQSTTRPNSILKQRTRSNPQLYNRPGTSASYATHLSSAGTQDSTRKHHPEGPPPWSLSSYNPDPSLPPDQQIIPTVAKRMQQEQWERDGSPADVYDRNLRPLRVHGDDEVERARHRRTLSQEQEEKPVEWPLKSSTTSSSEEPKVVRQDAGYKAMPNVSNFWAMIGRGVFSVRVIADGQCRLMATHNLEQRQRQFNRNNHRVRLGG